MKYYVETSLENFEAWSGGRDTLDVLIEKGLCDTVEACLEEILDGDVSDTYINDILWMERDMIAEWCGFSSWEALENGEEEEEEETAEEEEDRKRCLLRLRRSRQRIYPVIGNDGRRICFCRVRLAEDGYLCRYTQEHQPPRFRRQR